MGVAVFRSHGVWELQCVGVAMWELLCEGVAVRGSRGVGELQYERVAV